MNDSFNNIAQDCYFKVNSLLHCFYEGSFLALWNHKLWLKEKILLVVIFVTCDSQQIHICVEKFIIYSFSLNLFAPKSGKDPQNLQNHHLSPIFGSNLINWTMKNQTRQKDISARQSENIPLSTGDNEKVSYIRFFIINLMILSPKMGQKWWFLQVLRVLPLFRAIKLVKKRKWEMFPCIFERFWDKSYKYSNL